MRHRTALPFLDAFLKPTKHILLAYSFIIMYVNPAKFKKKKGCRIRTDDSHPYSRYPMWGIRAL